MSAAVSAGGSPVLPRTQQTFKLRKHDLQQGEQNFICEENTWMKVHITSDKWRDGEILRGYGHSVTGDSVTALASPRPRLSLGSCELPRAETGVSPVQ